MTTIQRTLLSFLVILVPLVALPANPVTPSSPVSLSGFSGPMWPNGVVPYRFDPGVNLTQQAFTLDAFEELEGVCGVRFIPENGHTNWLTIRPNPSQICAANCSDSPVGMLGGEQFFSVGSSHWTRKFILVHELMHTLGFEHEHKRPDRDNYVEYTPGFVNHSLCGTSCASQFEINQSIQTHGTPYDFGSVMHYGSDQFSNGGGPPLWPQPGYVHQEPLMGNTTHLTVHDVTGLQAVYGAPGAPQINGVVPGNIILGAPPATLSITGSGFYRGPGVSQGVQGTRVLWNNTPVTALVIDNSTIEVTVTPQMVALAGCQEIRVENPVAGGGVSNMMMVNVVDLNPAVDRFRGTQPGDELGSSVAGIPDVNGDGKDDLIVGAPGVAGERGRVACYSGETGAPLWFHQSQNLGERLGHSVAVLGDLNGDSVPDVVAGAPNYGNMDSGRIVVLSGADGSVLRTVLGLLDMEFGFAVCGGGDITGDGLDEIIVGAPGTGGNQGLVWVLNGQTGAMHMSLPGSGGRFGSSVAGGVSVGGLSEPDIVVGSPTFAANGQFSGRVQVYEGANGNLMKTLNGDGPFNRLGFSVAIVPGMQFLSGYNVVAGAPGGTGYVRIYKTSTFGYLPLMTIPGANSSDLYGYSVAFAGDLDQDGRGELIVGAPSSPSGAPGFVQVLSGLDQSVVFEQAGIANGSRFGASVAGAGDSRADTRGAVIVGVPDRDVWCEDGGEALVLHPAMPPAPGRLLITEVTWGQPDGVEITWHGDSGINLSGWKLEWRQSIPNVASLSGFLQSGQSMIVSELGGGPFPGASPSAPHLEAFGPIGTDTQAFEVWLRSPTGLVVDAVRIESSTQQTVARVGGPFRGLAERSSIDVGMERIWGLDSNSGGDWTAETKLSMGRENRNAGLRGSDPIPLPQIFINEICAQPDHVEIVRMNNEPVDLHNWSFLASGSNGGPISRIRPWRERHNYLGAFQVVGEGSRPIEMPQGSVYRDITLLGDNFPMTGAEFSLALYDSYGRLVDIVRTMGETAPIGHNHPRLPAHRGAFDGFAPRSTFGARCVGRSSPPTQGSSHGGEWRPIGTRSLGSFNTANWFFGNAGVDDLVDARIHVAGNGELTCILRADGSLATHDWAFMVSGGHLNGTGPFFGLGMDALANYQAFGMQPPFTGKLDNRNTARFDLTGPIAPGIDMDLIFFTFLVPSMPGAQVQISSQTSIIELDS